MTTQKWLELFRRNEKKLTRFVSRWCPGSDNYGTEGVSLPITAAGAEMARQTVCHEIKRSNLKSVWEKACKEGDVPELYSILSDAWMGVPESTFAWGLEGFPECVELLEDPLEEE